MKYCPHCQTTYTDDSLRYCLQDGTPLNESFASDSEMPTVAFDDAETIMSSRRVEPLRVPVQSPQTQNWRQAEPPVAAAQPEPKKSRTGLIVGLTILGTLLFLAIAGIGAMLYFRDRKTAVAVNVNNLPANRPLNANAAANQAANQTSNQTSNQASNQILNQISNANLADVSPTPTAAPTPMLNPQQAKAIAADVKDVVDEWKNATENLDLDAHLNEYADTVNYYRAGKVGLAQVRADKQRAYDQYDSVNINITNLKITPDNSGDKATALFDKEWTFEGDRKYSSGKVRQQLTFGKIGGRWLITGERDLKVYYVE